MLTPASTDPALTEKDYRYVFRCIPNDDEIARKLTGHLAEQGYKKMVVFYSDDAYGTGLAASSRIRRSGTVLPSLTVSAVTPTRRN